jgi:hypothetical protein
MTQEQINVLEKVINVAIYHGGDSGGPYCTHPEWLANTLDQLTEVFPGFKWDWSERACTIVLFKEE